MSSEPLRFISSSAALWEKDLTPGNIFAIYNPLSCEISVYENAPGKGGASKP